MFNRNSLVAACEAAAKVNAVLIAKGKLKQPETHVIKVGKSSGFRSSVDLFTAEFEINEVPINARNLLTKGFTQEEINQYSGAAVSTRGRYLSQEEKIKNPGERSLYLHIQGSTKQSVDLALCKIEEVIDQVQMDQPPSLFSQSKFKLPRPSIEKVNVGMEHAPHVFDLRNKLIGQGGANLHYIRNETGAIVTLRGKGSGFMEPTTGAESMEPLHLCVEHSKMDILQAARQLAVNLIETMQVEFAQFQQQQQPHQINNTSLHQAQFSNHNVSALPPPSLMTIQHHQPLHQDSTQQPGIHGMVNSLPSLTNPMYPNQMPQQVSPLSGPPPLLGVPPPLLGHQPIFQQQQLLQQQQQLQQQVQLPPPGLHIPTHQGPLVPPQQHIQALLQQQQQQQHHHQQMQQQQQMPQQLHQQLPSQMMLQQPPPNQGQPLPQGLNVMNTLGQMVMASQGQGTNPHQGQVSSQGFSLGVGQSMYVSGQAPTSTTHVLHSLTMSAQESPPNQHQHQGFLTAPPGNQNAPMAYSYQYMQNSAPPPVNSFSGFGQQQIISQGQLQQLHSQGQPHMLQQGIPPQQWQQLSQLGQINQLTQGQINHINQLPQNQGPPPNPGPPGPLQQGPPGPLQQGPPGQLQQGPPGQLQQGPPGQLQQGPPGQLQQGPPGQLQQGPPGQLQQGPPGPNQHQMNQGHPPNQGHPGSLQQGPPGPNQLQLNQGPPPNQGPPGSLQQGPPGPNQHQLNQGHPPNQGPPGPLQQGPPGPNQHQLNQSHPPSQGPPGPNQHQLNQAPPPNQGPPNNNQIQINQNHPQNQVQLQQGAPSQLQLNQGHSANQGHPANQGPSVSLQQGPPGPNQLQLNPSHPPNQSQLQQGTTNQLQINQGPSSQTQLQGPPTSQGQIGQGPPMSAQQVTSSFQQGQIQSLPLDIKQVQGQQLTPPPLLGKNMKRRFTDEREERQPEGFQPGRSVGQTPQLTQPMRQGVGVEELMQLNQQQRQQHQIQQQQQQGQQQSTSSGRSPERDKQLMPPPPPPVSTGEKRPADQETNGNKRIKGPGFNGDEEREERPQEHEEQDEGNNRALAGVPINRGVDFHLQRGGQRDRPSFNHYSSKPQLYNANLPFHMHYAPPPPPPPGGPQQQQIQPLLQPPPPPPAPNPQQFGGNYYTPPNQYQYNPYWMLPQ